MDRINQNWRSRQGNITKLNWVLIDISWNEILLKHRQSEKQIERSSNSGPLIVGSRSG